MPAEVNQVGDGGGPKEWFQSLPILTRYWFGAVVVCTLSGNFGFISPYSLLWEWERITNGFELWRIATCFCYAGPFQFPTLILVYLLVTFSRQYESGGPFNTGAGGGTADYAAMLLFGSVGTLVLKPLTDMFWPIGVLYTRNLTYFVVYVWSKKFPTAQSNIWGIPIKGYYLPFAYFALSVLVSAPWRDMVHGYAMGHLYFFLVDVMPNVYGKDFFFTPHFLIDQFGVGEYRPATDPRTPSNRPQVHRPHQWGSGGQSLGGSGPTGREASRSRPAPAPSAPVGSTRAAAAPRRQGQGHNWGSGGQRLGGS